VDRLTDREAPPLRRLGALEGIQRKARYQILVAFRRARDFRRRAIRQIEHAEVIAHVREAGGLSARFVLMVVLSAGIAIIGLLQNSPAVIIGAMLVSPLMGPIVALGLALPTIDYAQLRRSLVALAIGIPLALLFTAILVSSSPLQLVTSEILARTKPNFLDLAVALLSGLAGGYATVNRKGEAIVGVAIATALMPPLAVVGFGLATGNTAISGGALLLFLTNLVAIALSVAGVARWYRFTSVHSPKLLLWQTGATLLVFVALSIPLAFSLGDIARRASFTITATQLLKEEFGGRRSRIDNVAVDLDAREGALVSAVVLTPEYRAAAEKSLAAALSERIDLPVEVSLDQIVVAREDVQSVLGRQVRDAVRAQTAKLRQPLPAPDPEIQVRAALAEVVWFPTQAIEVEVPAKRIRVIAAPSTGAIPRALMDVEGKLHDHFADWDVRVVPPASALPPVFFEAGNDRALPDSDSRYREIAWTLRGWGVSELTVAGNASSSGSSRRNAALALQRAASAGTLLREAGFRVHIVSSFPAPAQRELERRFGRQYFQRVDFLLTPPDVTDPARAPLPPFDAGRR